MTLSVSQMKSVRQMNLADWRRPWCRVAAVMPLLWLTPSLAESQVSARSRDAILATVINQEMQRWPPETCILVADELGVAPSGPSEELMQQLHRRFPQLRSAFDKTCVRGSEVLWVGPIDSVTGRYVKVVAGRYNQPPPGRPTYVLKRNWLGRWKVTDILPAE